MDYPEKECEICGVWFTPHSTRARYCEKCRKHPEQVRLSIENQTERSIRMYGTGRPVRAIKCVCKECGKEFISYKYEKDFCCSKCKSTYRIKHTTCEYCKKPMTETEDVYDTQGKAWFCSDECHEKKQWEMARAAGTVKTCPNCGKEFIKTSTFCSRECYQENVQKKRERTAYLASHGLKECAHCGKEFSGNGKFCSKKCEQAKKDLEPHVKRRCLICGKDFSCPASETMFPACSDACKKELRIRLRKETKRDRDLRKKREEQKEKEKFIQETGLCSTCKTSYIDCERMQSNFTASPKGAVFKGSLVIKCPKYRK